MARTIRRVALGLGALLALLVAVLVVRTLMFTSVQREAPPSTLAVEPGEVAARLGAAIRFRTISGPAGEGPAPFTAMQSWLAETYPGAHRVLLREAVDGINLVYTWGGSDPAQKPVLFIAHQDVVPVEAGTEGDWTHPPFSGRIAPCGDEPGDCVWGRGAIDMKAALVGLFEAVERLAQAGFKPRRTLVFAFGADEEVGGQGAAAIARLFEQRKVRFAWTLDEGLLITDGLMPGLDAPVALIGLSEKGYTTLELRARGEGGHSSMPPDTTAVGVLARAIERLEQDPFPRAIDGAVAEMFDRVGPEMGFGQRLAFANRWLFEPIIVGQLAGTPSTNALLHTTQAPTMLSASMQENVLPQVARAVINYRIHPRDSAASVLERVRAVVDDERVEVRRLEGGTHIDPAPVASADGPGHRIVEAAIRASFPEAIVSSGLFIAATDTRHFFPLADDSYRFHPIRMKPADGARIHGTDERLRVADLAGLVRFYHHVLQAAAQ